MCVEPWKSSPRAAPTDANTNIKSRTNVTLTVYANMRRGLATYCPKLVSFCLTQCGGPRGDDGGVARAGTGEPPCATQHYVKERIMVCRILCAVLCALCGCLDFFILPHEGARRCTQVHIGAKRREIVRLCAEKRPGREGAEERRTRFSLFQPGIGGR